MKDEEKASQKLIDKLDKQERDRILAEAQEANDKRKKENAQKKKKKDKKEK